MPTTPIAAAADPTRTIESTRVIAAPSPALFDAFADPARLCQWWGPRGFTCTIHAFEFRPGGRFALVLHGPDGTDYPNEKTFVEIAQPARISFRHHQQDHGFLMTMEFVPQGNATRVNWRMVFDQAEDCAKARPFIVEANEQNFDRLQGHLGEG